MSQGLDRPLPVAAAANMGADEPGFRISARKLGQVTPIRNSGLVFQWVMKVTGVVEDRYSSSIAVSIIRNTTGSVHLCSL